MTIYVCYDLRAIQSFILRVPRLKYIVGGSAIIDDFDRKVAPACGTAIFCAGGKGAFVCADEAEAAAVEQRLIGEARQRGLDIRIGSSEDFFKASHEAERLYPFVPDRLEGHPCQASGAFPVAAGEGKGEHRDVHPIVERRIVLRGDLMYRRFEERLLGSDLDLGPGVIGLESTFLRSIDPWDDEAMGRAGAAALEGGNGWAVVCMDGNDMGRQFRHQYRALRTEQRRLESWIGAMSKALDGCSLAAARAGIERVVRLWSHRLGNRLRTDCTADGQVVLPIRPLVVGGDDLIVLCHADFAFEFVSAASEAWSRAAVAAADSHRERDLWPATGNRLTISAGVLFAPISLPLHVAIPYAESLLASAKHRGRAATRDCQASPAAIDWESVTESILDSPAARRQRDLRFRDEDIGEEVRLTEKPYLMPDFERLRQRCESLRSLPRSIRQDVGQSLRRPWNDRELYRIRIAKRHPALSKLLDERGIESAWTRKDRIRTTWLLDALSLIETGGGTESTEASR